MTIGVEIADCRSADFNYSYKIT